MYLSVNKSQEHTETNNEWTVELEEAKNYIGKTAQQRLFPENSCTEDFMFLPN